jgi:hypothetical protein
VARFKHFYLSKNLGVDFLGSFDQGNRSDRDGKSANHPYDKFSIQTKSSRAVAKSKLKAKDTNIFISHTTLPFKIALCSC